MHTRNIWEGNTVNTALLTPVAEGNDNIIVYLEDDSYVCWEYVSLCYLYLLFLLNWINQQGQCGSMGCRKYLNLVPFILKPCGQGLHMHFIIVLLRQLVFCLVSMGTTLLGKIKPLTNESTPPSTFCAAAGLEGVIVSKVTHCGRIHGHMQI